MDEILYGNKSRSFLLSQRTETRNGAKAFSQMNSSMVVKIVTVATVTVGDMDVAVEPIGTLLVK